jgi:predicted nuclease with TOPRIM domain
MASPPDQLSPQNPLVAGAISFVVGGGFVQLVGRLIDSWQKRGEQKATLQDSLRDELREEATRLLVRVKEQDVELDALRDKYFALREENAKLVAEVEILRARIEQQGQLAQKAVTLAIDSGAPPGFKP